MPIYCYDIADEQGRRVTGQLKAPNAQRAAAQLERDGQRIVLLAATDPRPIREAALPEAELLRLVGHSGQRSGSGSLSEGVRALARERGGTASRGLWELSARLDAGMPLEVAVRPAYGRGASSLTRLLQAPAGSTDSAKHHEEFLERRARLIDLRRRAIQACIYPGFILLCTLAVVLLFATLVIQPLTTELTFVESIAPNSIAVRGLSWLGQHSWTSAGIFACLLVIAEIVRRRRGTWWLIDRLRVLIPGMSRLSWYTSLTEWASVMRILTDCQVPLPEALASAAEDLDSAQLASASRALAEEVREGWPLSHVLELSDDFPASTAEIVRWGERTNSLSNSFAALANLCEARAKSSLSFMQLVLPIAAALVAGGALLAILASVWTPIQASLILLNSFAVPPGPPNVFQSIGQGSFACILLGAVMITAGRVVHRSKRGGPLDPMHALLVTGGQIMAAVGGCLLTLALLGPVLGMLYLQLVAAAWLMIRSLHNSDPIDDVLRTLAWITARGMPLAPVVSAIAQGEQGSLRRRLARLASLLEQGVPLPEALERIPRLVPGDIRATLLSASDAGRLTECLKETADARKALLRDFQPATSRLEYLGMVMILTSFVSLVTLNFPNISTSAMISKIFWEFELGPLPPFAVWVVNQGLVIANVTLAFMLFAGLWIYWSMPTAFHWNLPWLGTAGRFNRARILRLLAVVAAANRPLSNALARLAAEFPGRSMRRRLQRWSNAIEQGDDWIASAERHGMISASDAEVLIAAERVGNLPWALRSIADRMERRGALRLGVLSQLSLPVVVVIFGCIVTMQALLVLLPLVEMVQSGARP